jgi:hypothetical protein
MNLYSVVLSLSSDPRLLPDDLQHRLKEELPIKASFCGDGDGHLAVCFDSISADSEANARFKATRLWDHVEDFTGIVGFKSHAIRDLMAERRRDAPVTT